MKITQMQGDEFSNEENIMTSIKWNGRDITAIIFLGNV
jgi:hypothetical protein